MSPENKETKKLFLECGDGRTRMVEFFIDTGLIKSSIVIAEPVEMGWEREDSDVAAEQVGDFLDAAPPWGDPL